MKKGASKKSASKTSVVAAPSPSKSVELGTKRTCPKCVTKFYDFKKDPILCPKCDHEVDPDKVVIPKAAPERSRSKNSDKAIAESMIQQDDVELGSSDDTFESLEDLSDDEEDAVEGIEVDSDADEDA